MFKSLSLVVLVVAIGAASAASLEWPANLVALSTGKSVQALPLTAASEESVELEAENSGTATANAAAAESEEEESLSETSSGSSDAQDAQLLSSDASAVPVSVPLPLILAARSGLRTVLTIQEPALARVGNLVEHVPTAISHQSQTVVHDHRRLVTPIVAPAVRTTKLVRQQQPVVWTVSTDPRVVLLRD